LEPALPAGSEGPSLIPCAAGCIEVAAFLHHGFLSAPSWRTVIGELHEIDDPCGLGPYQKVHLVVHHDNPTRDLNAARAVGDLPSARTPSPLVSKEATN
jgi:hypothetical protein